MILMNNPHFKNIKKKKKKKKKKPHIKKKKKKKKKKTCKFVLKINIS